MSGNLTTTKSEGLLEKLKVENDRLQKQVQHKQKDVNDMNLTKLKVLQGELIIRRHILKKESSCLLSIEQCDDSLRWGVRKLDKKVYCCEGPFLFSVIHLSHVVINE